MNRQQDACKILNILTGSYILDANGEVWMFDSYVAATRYIDFIVSLCPNIYTNNQFEIVYAAMDIVKQIVDKAVQKMADEIDKQFINEIYKFDDTI